MTFIGHDKLWGIDLASRADVAAAVVVGSAFTIPSGEDGKRWFGLRRARSSSSRLLEREGFVLGFFNWVVIMSVDGA